MVEIGYDDELVIVKIARPGDGGIVELSGGDQLEPLPAVGDEVPVVVDPKDPSDVLAAGVDWAIPSWGYLLGLVATVVLGGLGLWIAFA